MKEKFRDKVPSGDIRCKYHGPRKASREHTFLTNMQGHLVFKDVTCQRGQMRIHMHPDDYEEFKATQLKQG